MYTKGFLKAGDTSGTSENLSHEMLVGQQIVCIITEAVLSEHERRMVDNVSYERISYQDKNTLVFIKEICISSAGD
ncbi:MAG TPA: hypothetical protein VMU21_01055, partial [Thermodesulfovibrionales bacterium]|nr:hypothetical protein [Thermodesulfovibrionales bacterium]